MLQPKWLVITTYGRVVLQEEYDSFLAACVRAGYQYDVAAGVPNLHRQLAVTVVEVAP